MKLASPHLVILILTRSLLQSQEERVRAIVVDGYERHAIDRCVSWLREEGCVEAEPVADGGWRVRRVTPKGEALLAGLTGE